MRNPADTGVKNWHGSDWYELRNAYRWTAQSGTHCPELFNSAQIYGHNGYEFDFNAVDHWRYTDDDPPVITINLNGSKNEDDSYEDSVSISVSASDPDGVDTVEYKLDDGDWTAYSSPVNVTAVGVHKFTVKAVDEKGNIAYKSVYFEVSDQTS